MEEGGGRREGIYIGFYLLRTVYRVPMHWGQRCSCPCQGRQRGCPGATRWHVRGLCVVGGGVGRMRRRCGVGAAAAGMLVPGRHSAPPRGS